MSRRKRSLWLTVTITLLILISTGGVCWQLGWVPISWEKLSTGHLLSKNSTEDSVSISDDDLNMDPIVDNAETVSNHQEQQQLASNQFDLQNKNSSGQSTLTRTNPPNLLPVPQIDGESFIPEGTMAFNNQPSDPPTGVQPQKNVRPISGDGPRSSNLQPPSIPTTAPQMSVNQAEEAQATSIETKSKLQQAEAAFAKSEDLTALRLLSELYWNEPQIRPTIQQRIETLAERVFFSPRPHYLEPYVIQSGDQLTSVAKKYLVSWQYLASLNQTNPRRLQLGQRLKVIQGPFAAVVSLKNHELIVHLQGYYVKRFRVGIGKDNSTPAGKYKVLNKVVNPQYTDPDGRVFSGDDPVNPLGKRWLDLGNSYGIHGTIEPQSIGQAHSRGCIRLLNSDVEQLYDLLTVGSEVIIQP